MPGACVCLDRRGFLGNRDKPIAVQQPQQARLIQVSERPLGGRANKIAQCPPKNRGLFHPSVAAKIGDIVDQPMPTAQRNIAGRKLKRQTGETLDPF